MLNRRMPNGTYGGVRGRFNPPYSIINYQNTADRTLETMIR